MLSFTSQLFHLAERAKHVELYKRAGQIVGTMYSLALEQEGMREIIGSLVDSEIESAMLGLFSYSLDRSAEEDPRLPPLRLAALRWILDLIKTAIEHDRSQDALYFFDRMCSLHDRAADPSFQEPDAQLISSSVYGQILLLGWCMRLVTSQPEKKQAAIALGNKIIKAGFSQNEIMSAWRGTPNASRGGNLIDARHWDRSQQPFRSGISHATFGSPDWPFRGFIAMLLASHKLPDSYVAYELSPEKTRPEEDAIVRETIQKILQEPAQQPIIEIAEAEKASAEESVVRLFSQARRDYKLAEIEHLVAAAPAPKLIETLRSDLLTFVRARRSHWLLQLVRRENAPSANATFWPLPIRWTIEKKRSFIEGGQGSLNWAEVRAHDLAISEEQRVVWGLEALGIRYATLQDRTRLQEKLHDTINALRLVGYEPDVILLPQGERFIFPLFEKATWQISSRRTEASGHLGRWEGCDIYHIPYANCEAILVMDSMRALGRHKPEKSDLIQFQFTDLKDSEHQKMLSRARQESDEAKFPQLEDFHVDVKLSLLPEVGLADTAAVGKVEIDLKTLGYGLKKAENVYHRPDSACLGIGEIRYSLATQLEAEEGGRAPCPQCKPDEWDDPSLVPPADSESPTASGPTRRRRIRRRPK